MHLREKAAYIRDVGATYRPSAEHYEPLTVSRPRRDNKQLSLAGKNPEGASSKPSHTDKLASRKNGSSK